MTAPEIWWHPGSGSGPALYIQAEMDQPHIWMYPVGSPAELPEGAVALRPAEDATAAGHGARVFDSPTQVFAELGANFMHIGEEGQ